MPELKLLWAIPAWFFFVMAVVKTYYVWAIIWNNNAKWKELFRPWRGYGHLRKVFWPAVIYFSLWWIFLLKTF